MIELQFKLGQYESTYQVRHDVRKIIMNKMKIAIFKSDDILNAQIEEFYKFSEDTFSSLQLEQLSL